MGREVTGELTRDCSSVVEKKAEEFLPQAFPQVCLGERQEEGSLGSGPSPATGLLLVTVGKTSALLDLPPPPPSEAHLLSLLSWPCGDGVGGDAL